MPVEQVRNYEISIWTLQDSFITVLKPLNLEFKGVIQDGTITLQDDGVNNISFSIPMYIMHNGQQIENPLWYTRQQGNLIANLRKLKVIFNKFTSDERIFEFIITGISDSHDGFTKICQVTGDGLAFNELGKQGYKITLSAEDLYNEAEDLAEQGSSAIINNNIKYWVDKVLVNSNWRYSIQMDWSAFDGIIDYTAKEYENLSETIRNDRNNTRENMGLRRRDTIYEDSYVSAWCEENGKILPATIQGETEKLRIVEESESNKYNLLQKIAEIFGVYIKFKYYYDDNYHIIDKEVIFYNNFLNEDEIIDLTYKYDTQTLSRELDANDIVTKMFIKTLDDDSSPSGLVSIMDTTANKTGEDYILNFDYLHDINTISEEQYAAIEEFENQIGVLNKQIVPLDSKIIALEEELLDCEVKRDNADLAIQQADENISDLQEFLDNVMDGKENLEVIAINPAHIILTQNDNGTYKGRFETQYSGIIPGTIQVYKTYNSSNLETPLTDQIESFTTKAKQGAVQYLTFASSIFPNENDKKDFFYATFSYRPTIEKENVQKEYQILANRQREIYSNMIEKIDGNNPLAVTGTKEELGLTKYIKQQKEIRKALYEQKQKIIADFENLMGPALREGNWQPEDEYSSYGETHEEIYQPTFNNTTISGESGILKFIWDNDLFEDEEKNYYETGILQKKVYYPCINLSQLHPNIFNKLQSKEFLSALNFTYKDNNNPHAQLNVLPIGSCCQLAFLREKNGNTILPVLMVTDINDVEEITNEASSKAALDKIKEFSNACISYVSVDNLLTINPTIDNETIFSVPADSWVNNPYLYEIVYPRFEVNSDYLKTSKNELMLSIYRENASSASTVITYLVNLEEYNNYYVLKKDAKMYITIKPESLFLGKVGEAKIKVNFSISNTALQIYLDGIKIMKENAYPKVSYNLSNLLSKKLIYNTYDRLGQLAHINDYELKLDNVMGYISAVTLNLDNPWQDSITIQNYKNKFEDLFSNIVAQTESMQQNSYKIGVALNSFSADGKLTCALDDLSLLSSTQVLNSLIKNNADVIAAKTISTTAKDKALLASTDIYRVMHGEVGLQFQGNAIKEVTLNKDKGLLIEGYDPSVDANSAGKKTPVFFNLTNDKMGFFRGHYAGVNGTTSFNEECLEYNNNPMQFMALNGYKPEPLLAFQNGDLAILGTILAKNGWFGGERGWIIGEGLTDDDAGKLTYTDANGIKVTTKISDTDLGGLLFSANGKVIFTAGTDSTKPKIILSKNGFPDITTTNGKADTLFLFDGDNLYVNGVITAASGNIGGWTIGSHYLGDATTQLLSHVGMASGKDDSESTQRFSFWAGGAYNATPKFSVSPEGYLTAQSGKIGGWTLKDDRLYNKAAIEENGVTKNYFSGIKVTGTYVLSIGANEDNDNGWTKAPFRVTHKGKVYATDAEIEGKITATSGTIGASDGNKITIGGVSQNRAYIYSGVTSVGDISHDGFYLGTDGLTIGTGVFKVTPAGAVTAKSGTIGGWTINAKKLYNKVTIEEDGTDKNYFAGLKVDGTYVLSIGADVDDETKWNNAPFRVSHKGKLYATGAEITGKITATSGTIGANDGNKITIGGIKDNSQNRAFIYSGVTSVSDTTHEGFYLGTDGLTLGKGIFKVDTNGAVTASNIIITGGQLEIGSTFSVSNLGEINATSGSIAGWNLDNTQLTSNSGKVGIGTEDYSFWAGSTTPASAAFSVTKGGKLTSTSLYVGKDNNLLTYDSNGLTVKGSITANSLAVGSGDNTLTYNNNTLTVTGTINAKAGNIGGCSIDANGVLKVGSANIESINASLIQAVELSADNIKSGTLSGRTISGGSISIGTDFSVDSNGHMICNGAEIDGSGTFSGTVTAAAGRIGGWTIGSNYIGTGTTRGNSTVGMSNYITGSSDETKLVFWAGNPNTTPKETLTVADIPFSVNRSGVLRASKVNITGGTFNIKFSKSISIPNPEDETNPIIKSYTGEFSINENHKYIYDTINTNDMPCPLFIKEKTFTQGYEYMYYCDGNLRFSASDNGLYNTQISSSRIETPELFTKNVSIRSNYIFLSSGKSSGNITMIAGATKVGLQADTAAATSWEDSWDTGETTYQTQWIIYKGVNTNNIYLNSSSVKMRNSGDTDWIDILGTLNLKQVNGQFSLYGLTTNNNYDVKDSWTADGGNRRLLIKALAGSENKREIIIGTKQEPVYDDQGKQTGTKTVNVTKTGYICELIWCTAD